MYTLMLMLTVTAPIQGAMVIHSNQTFTQEVCEAHKNRMTPTISAFIHQVAPHVTQWKDAYFKCVSTDTPA